MNDPCQICFHWKSSHQKISFYAKDLKKEISVGVLTLHRKIGHVYKDFTIKELLHYAFSFCFRSYFKKSTRFWKALWPANQSRDKIGFLKNNIKQKGTIQFSSSLKFCCSQSYSFSNLILVPFMSECLIHCPDKIKTVVHWM